MRAWIKTFASYPPVGDPTSYTMYRPEHLLHVLASLVEGRNSPVLVDRTGWMLREIPAAEWDVIVTLGVCYYRGENGLLTTARRGEPTMFVIESTERQP